MLPILNNKQHSKICINSDDLSDDKMTEKKYFFIIFYK